MTVDDLIEKMGGRTCTAEKLDITYSAVCKWPKTGIPPKHWREIVALTGESYEALAAIAPSAETAA